MKKAIFFAAILVTIAASGCGGLLPSPTPTATPLPPTPTPEPTPTPITVAGIIEALTSSTVLIFVEMPEGSFSGTGVIIDESGLTITNAHVVEGAAIIKAYIPGIDRWLSAQLVGLSTCEDLAVIDISGEGYVPATLGDSNKLTLGEEVIALGYPLVAQLGADLTVNRGVVSKLHAQQEQFQDLIQTDVDMNPGNSGGPLANMQGEVIGINTMGLQYSLAGQPVSGVNFAIASSHAKSIIERLKAGENLHWIGANAFTNDPDVASYFGLAVEEGLYVYAVTDGSPAAKAGMEMGDVLVTMKGINVYTMADVCDVVRSNPEGQPIPVQVIRGTEALEGEIWGEPLSAKFSLAPEWMTYTRDDLYFSVAYPGDWEVGEDEQGVTFSRPGSKTFVAMDAIFFEGYTTEEANQYVVDYFLDYYADIDPNLWSSEVYAFPLGGVEGLTVDYEYVDQDGDLMSGFVIASTIEGWTYIFEAGSLKDDYEAELEVFNEMLFSLQLFTPAAAPTTTRQRLIDTFDDNRNGWFEGEEEGVYSIYIQDGAYHMVSIYQGEDVDSFVLGATTIAEFSNFDLDVDATQVEGTDNNEIAVVFGVQDLNNFYEFAISGDGYVALGRYVGGAFEFIQEFTPSETIIQGNATNHIRLIMENGNLTAYVNGELALTSVVGEYGSGYMGFGCGPFEAPFAHCAFDNVDLMVW